MRVARIAVLWALAVALGVVHSLEERRAAAPAPVDDGVPGAPLVAIDATQIVAIEVVEGPTTVRLAAFDGGWEVVGSASIATRDLAGAFVAALLDARILDSVDVAADAGRPFGLNEARRIEVEGRDGSRFVLVVGSETPTGTAAYVRDGSGTVRVIGRNPLVYRDLLLDAVRPGAGPPTEGPIAEGPLTEATRSG